MTPTGISGMLLNAEENIIIIDLPLLAFYCKIILLV